MKRARAILAVLAPAAFVGLAVLGSGCGDSKPPPAFAAPTPGGPRWEDAFERIPELLAVVHPQALRRDKVYGPLLRRLSQIAATRSSAVAATRSLEAFESCEELLAAMDEEGASVLVMRGVRADLDPSKLVDAQGAVLWRTEVGARVPEYVRQEGTTTASLFVLPARTWVIAVGDARARAREAFAHPSGRPTLRYDADALISVRIHGPTLLQHVRQLRTTGALSTLGSHLGWASIALAPGADGAIAATLTYTDDESAARAEVTARHVIDVIRDKDVPRFRWLVGAKITRDEPRTLVLRAPLPATLLEALGKASDARDLDDPDLPSP